jgi:hypothetical protein
VTTIAKIVRILVKIIVPLKVEILNLKETSEKLLNLKKMYKTSMVIKGQFETHKILKTL